MFRLQQVTLPGDLRVQVSKQSQQTATFETRFTPALEQRFYPRRRAVTVTSASSTPACRGWAVYFGHGITRLALHGSFSAVSKRNFRAPRPTQLASGPVSRSAARSPFMKLDWKVKFSTSRTPLETLMPRSGPKQNPARLLTPGSETHMSRSHLVVRLHTLEKASTSGCVLVVLWIPLFLLQLVEEKMFLPFSKSRIELGVPYRRARSCAQESRCSHSPIPARRDRGSFT